MMQRFLVLEQSIASFFAHLKSPDGRIEFAVMEAKLRRPKASD
ncbi:hypothetical protein PI125_g4541 [Phytophthora idaei]|nr:hypothetical protein PI125_g4541 [Phytophthora idaei]KAG3159837.1 hypothetical protein PI126_g7192 [Phytophthora idaei]